MDNTPRERPGQGFVPSPPDDRDHTLRMYVPGLREVVRQAPSTFIPYSRTLPVYDQGSSPRCVAYSAALGSTIDHRRDHRRTVRFDPDPFYAECKAEDGIPTVAGTFPRIALKIKQERGMQAVTGKRHLIAAYARLNSIDDVIAAIHLYGSAALGSTWWAEWDGVAPDGTLRPGTTDVGGHAYTAVGWSRRRGALLVQNSWGDTWGVRIGLTPGRAWLPFPFIDFDGDWEAWRSVDLQDQ